MGMRLQRAMDLHCTAMQMLSTLLNFTLNNGKGSNFHDWRRKKGSKVIQLLIKMSLVKIQLQEGKIFILP